MKKFWGKIRKWAVPTLLILSLTGVAIVLVIVNNEQGKISCDNVKISVIRKGEATFVSEKEVEELVRKKCRETGNESAGINTADIEKSVEEIPSVKNAEVFRKINGEVNVEIEQRVPVCRIHEQSGNQYYLDENGELFPINKNYTARVPLVNGYLNEPYAKRLGLMDSDSVKRISLLDDISVLFREIRKDEFRNALVEQVWITEKGEFEIIPKIDDHIIIFGDTTEISGKFNKLKIFYEEGLNTKGWNVYKTVNLKYKNQIICKK